jgi:hypothetical protein
MRSTGQRDAVAALVRAGMTDAEIARRLGIPQRTVNHWRHRPKPARQYRRPPCDWRPTDVAAYCYLLGLYLGDGYVANARGAPFLQVYLDARYPRIVQEAADAIATTVPGAAVHRYSRREKEIAILQASSWLWPAIFPQHGKGKKHERRIVLTDWQLAITHEYPRELVRGLIHSDGCRTVNRFCVDLPVGGRRQYEYVRYFFSNLSADIRQIFVAHCQLLGIRCTRSNHRNISVSHRHSVAVLESFVGPKR